MPPNYFYIARAQYGALGFVPWALHMVCATWPAPFWLFWIRHSTPCQSIPRRPCSWLVVFLRHSSWRSFLDYRLLGDRLIVRSCRTISFSTTTHWRLLRLSTVSWTTPSSFHGDRFGHQHIATHFIHLFVLSSDVTHRSTSKTEPAAYQGNGAGCRPHAQTDIRASKQQRMVEKPGSETAETDNRP